MMVEFCRKCGTLLRGKKCVCGTPSTTDQLERMKGGNFNKDASRSNEKEGIKALKIPKGEITILRKTERKRKKRRIILRPKCNE